MGATVKPPGHTRDMTRYENLSKDFLAKALLLVCEFRVFNAESNRLLETDGCYVHGTAGS